MEGIPALLIDPKGDLANPLLAFPRLSPAEFAPWVNADEARSRGADPEAYAAAEAMRWKRSLESWPYPATGSAV